MAQATTRVDEIYRRLRTDILSGRHQPGARLLSATLCQDYGISSGVLREILPRLAGEGLVVSEPQRGFRVARISVEDLQHLTEARVLVESTALRAAIEHGDLQWESTLVAAHHTLAGSRSMDDDGAIQDDWMRAHWNFHHCLLSACPNRRLLQIADQFRDATEMYRCWSGPLGDEPDRDVAGEHRGILEATVGRDAELAVRLLTEHYEHTLRIMSRVGALSGAPSRAG
ncbi:GntR family transcriptional regulator [Pseudonocardia xishanensis]